jgi:preprotein translocase subunit SecE
MQEPELFLDQEQENHYRASGVEEVLPALQAAPAAQGNQVEYKGAPRLRGATQGRRFNGRPAVSKTASGGSNPSAPANYPLNSWEYASKGRFMAEVIKWVQSTKDYFNELKLEMRRVTWPNRKQVEGTTVVVIVSVFAFAGYFAVVDSLLAKGVKGVLQFFTK